MPRVKPGMAPGTLTSVGLPGRLRKFFVENPDEELSRSDIVEKFECSLNAADKVVHKLKKMGVLEASKVYRLASGAEDSE